jgi:hypothetical protein
MRPARRVADSDPLPEFQVVRHGPVARFPKDNSGMTQALDRSPRSSDGISEVTCTAHGMLALWIRGKSRLEALSGVWPVTKSNHC